jgi:acyl-coenzyme A thioesterase PaaI-like protein
MKIMKKIKNPYSKIEGYNCFACSPHNEFGLKMNFVDEDDVFSCYWDPVPHFQGYNNILHGGIQATLMDEIAAWFINAKIGTGGVTAKLEARYKKPVFTNKGSIKLTAVLKERSKRIASIEVNLYNNDGSLAATGVVDYFLLSTEKASEQLMYPGQEAFYEN